MEIINNIIENWSTYAQVILAVIGAAAAIAAITPTPRDDRFVAFLRKIIDVIGMNVGNAKNDPDLKR